MKSLNNNFLLVVFIFLMASACQGKIQSTEADVYNLGFEKPISFIKSIDNWHVSGCSNKIGLDTVNVNFGNSSAKVDVYSSPYPEAQSLRIFQTIYLPVRAEKLDVSLWLKGGILKGGYLKICLFNANEVVVSRDSVNFMDSSKWKKYDLTIDGNESHILFLEINLAQNSKVWLDQLEIKVNGKSIYQYLTIENRSNIIKDTAGLHNAIALQTNDTFNIGILKDFKDKRLIAIGESVHGIHEMAETRNQLIKYLVKNENCKLIVLEAPDCFVESLNQYVQGFVPDEEVLKAKDIDKVQFYIYSEEMFQLLKWVKEYNKLAQRKVTIAGMDVSDCWRKQLHELLNTYKKDEVVKKMIQFELDNNSDSLMNIVAKKRSHLITVLNESQYNYLSMLTDKFNQFLLVYRSNFNLRGRDSIMAKNVKNLMVKYTTVHEKTVVCGHLGHLNKLNLSASITPSVGNWLSDHYKEDYFVIAQLVGSGKYQAYQINPDIPNINPLQSPITGSVEEICARTPLESFYTTVQSSDIFKDRLMLFRDIGGIQKENQFYPGNLYRRFDAIMFLQHGTPLLFYQRKLKEYYINK